MGLKMIRTGIIILTMLVITSCQSTRYEMFQGEPIPLKPGEALVHR